jgi:hypothetical protein
MDGSAQRGRRGFKLGVSTSYNPGKLTEGEKEAAVDEVDPGWCLAGWLHTLV